MTAERWEQVRPLFFELAELGPEERAGRLEVLSQGDPELRAELDRLLAAHDRSEELLGSFEDLISKPPVDLLLTPDDRSTTPDPHGLIGRAVSHYEVLKALGAGGMGVLYEATDTQLGRTVALKFLPPQWGLDADFKERFLREARAAAALDHPNVCAIYEAGETDEGQLFIAMAYYHGETVKEMIGRGPLEVEEVFDLAEQAASGLAAAHRAGLVHRDIKPANLMVTEGGVLKILDFGLAKTGEEGLTDSGMVLGTPAYMSPEQTRGEEVDARTDLWSLGVVLYEMLTGQRPFRGGSHTAVIHAIRREEPRLPSKLRADVPTDLEQTVLRLLSKDPEERYEGAELLSGELATAAGMGRSTWSRLSVRTKLAAGLALGLLATLAVIGALDLVPRFSSPPAIEASNRVAVLPFTYRGSEQHRYLAEGMVAMLSETLDGAGELSTVDPTEVLEIVGEPAGYSRENAPDLADSLNAGRYVVGEIVQAGTRLRVNARLYRRDAAAEPEMQATVEGSPDSTFVLVADLTAAMLVSNALGPEHRFTRLAAVTTDSLGALKAYLEGDRLLRSGGSPGAAQAAFLRAIAIDSAFALAWMGLSTSVDYQVLSMAAIDAAEMAVIHSQDLDARDRAYLEGQLFHLRGEIEEAERRLHSILERYPRDFHAWQALCFLEFVYDPMRGRPLPPAHGPCERALQYNPDDREVLWVDLRLEAMSGHRDHADSLLLRLSPDRQPGSFMHAVRDFGVGDSTQRAQILSEQLHSADSYIISFYVAGLFHEIRASLEFARSAWLRAEDSDMPPRWHAAYELRIAMLEATLGRWEAAKAQLANVAGLQRAWAIEYGGLWSLSHAPPRDEADLLALRDSLLAWDAALARHIPTGGFVDKYYMGAHNGVHEHLRHYLLGRVSQRLGEEEAALRYADELERMETPAVAGSLSRDLAQAIRAWVHWGRGDAVAALEALESAPRHVVRERLAGSPFFAQPQERYLRAQILESLRRYDEALEWYDSFWMPSIYDVIHLAPSHLRRAEIYRRLGDAEQARQHYVRFIELWQDADPEFQPQVAAAREALEALDSDA
jgi:serine/threonine protein kinase/tetratricopeptide (TPR) repeat protein